jgi:hypothetical protein
MRMTAHDAGRPPLVATEAARQIQVRELLAADEGAYTQFVAGHGESLVYATLPFRDFLREAAGGEPRYLVAWSGGEVRGVLPCFQRRHAALGEVWNSLPWYGSHGGCLVADKEADPTRDVLLDAFLREAGRPEVLSATVILSPDDEPRRPVYERRLAPATTDHRIGQWTRLPPEGPDLARRLEAVFQQKTRNLVRKALKQSFREACTDDEWAWRFLHEVHHENMSAIGAKPKPWEHFASLKRHIPPAWRRLSVALLGDQPVAALLLLLFRHTVEYITPVVRREYRAHQPLSFLIFHGMREAVERGYHHWNWGGTWATQHSLYHFKAGFGAVERPYTYLVVATAESRARLRAARKQIGDAFSYYYVYPFAQLDEGAPA